ncbi:MAG: 1-(5-phosphoribosyl)-5-[(5-phosphoribosylamino)methylideneamino]imidazole-4-carboxamide isomerase [Bacteroidota bacterium]|nr:1-(5-phosphoribosyl)-5-[(5-phosphoribosylamino)methylideneamino]imidazole-4-carboxamide isomerase [Bacteroidota bacterium]
MIEIIPAIDIIAGSCVRLEKGDFTTSKIYNTNPVDVAKRFADAGLKLLHLVDLDGAKCGKVMNLKVLENIAKATNLIIDFGGGIRTFEDAEMVLNAGAKMVNLGSMAVKNPHIAQRILDHFGADYVILGADVKDECIAVSGWTEEASISLWEFLQDWIARGIEKVCCTDVSKDGMLSGPAFDLYATIRDDYPYLKLIASGGISNIDDVYKLNELGIPAVIIGKAIYEGKISLEDITNKFIVFN